MSWPGLWRTGQTTATGREFMPVRAAAFLSTHTAYRGFIGPQPADDPQTTSRE